MLLVSRLSDLNLPTSELSRAVAAHDVTLLQLMFDQQLHHLNDMLPTAKVLLGTVALCSPLPDVQASAVALHP